MIVNVCELAGARKLLAGRALARKALGSLISTAVNPSVPTVLLLDFRSSSLTTASFFAELVLGFSRHARVVLPNLYPVSIVTDQTSLQEVEFLTESTGEVVPICAGAKLGHLKDLRLIGALDPPLLETLQKVETMGGASAKDLAEAVSTKQSKIGLTGWHNRLSSLSRKGLLIEDNKGRQKIYRSLSEGA